MHKEKLRIDLHNENVTNMQLTAETKTFNYDTTCLIFDTLGEYLERNEWIKIVGGGGANEITTDALLECMYDRFSSIVNNSDCTTSKWFGKIPVVSALVRIFITCNNPHSLVAFPIISYEI